MGVLPPKGGGTIRARRGPRYHQNTGLNLARTDTILVPMTPCTEWVGKTNRDGYGYLNIRRPGDKWRLRTAHRLAFEMATGAPAEGLVLHRCNNRKCINPEHLYDSDHAQNMRDRAASGNNRSGRDRLTPELVSQIRELCKKKPQRAVADLLGLPKSTVGDVMSGKCWKDMG